MTAPKTVMPMFRRVWFGRGFRRINLRRVAHLVDAANGSAANDRCGAVVDDRVHRQWLARERRPIARSLHESPSLPLQELRPTCENLVIMEYKATCGGLLQVGGLLSQTATTSPTGRAGRSSKGEN